MQSVTLIVFFWQQTYWIDETFVAWHGTYVFLTIIALKNLLLPVLLGILCYIRGCMVNFSSLKSQELLFELVMCHLCSQGLHLNKNSKLLCFPKRNVQTPLHGDINMRETNFWTWIKGKWKPVFRGGMSSFLAYSRGQ